MPKPEISIAAVAGSWVIRAEGAVIGESERAVEVVEAGRPAVLYFPREDLGMALLDRSSRVETSPALGEARFFSIVTPALTLEDAAWSYEAPAAGADRIRGFVAFDALRVLVEEVDV
jgi:uncharacterized protein (DUF427 family)